MNNRTLEKLEYSKIIAQLADCTMSNLGRELAENLLPTTEEAEIRRRQQETQEARELLRVYPDLPWSGLKDPRQAVGRAKRGAVLAPEELLAVADSMRASRRLKRFFAELKEHYPLLQEYAANLASFKPVEDAIYRAILPGGEVADEASPRLAALRRQIRSHSVRVKEKLEQIIRSPEWQKMLQDPIVTQRGDRYVVPVKNEYRGQFPGLIHDQSGSGATLFIEPMAVVEINNDLKRLKAEEEEEIERILQELTARVVAEIDQLELAVEALAHLDFALAKGTLSQRWDGVGPKLNRDGYIYIKGGRHPLIKGRVVPVTIWLGRDFTTLIITGPNTGGKTVTLKTVGLFVILAQAGLHLPAELGTEIGLYQQIFCDIGDEQSIEQSLSTFSSHMTNIISILAEADRDSLVLLDELGAGTDPAEGAALAQAILEELHRRGAKTIATTHYSQLKTFAFSQPGIENASVEFDVNTLQPTYRLLIGQPGSSNALQIAARLGLAPELVERARSFMSKAETEMADLIQSLEASQRAAEAERQEAERLRRESERLRQEYAQLKEKLEAQRERILARAREEAWAEVKKARQEAENIVAELKARLAEAPSAQTLQAAYDARSRLRKLQADKAVTPTTPSVAAGGRPPRELEVGDRVKVLSLNQEGTVVGGIKPGVSAVVQVGALKMTVRWEDLRLRAGSDPEAGQVQGAGSLMSAKTAAIKRELDLRGMTVDEALYELEKYLDNALVAGLNQVYVIHGKGTGALRKAITQALKEHPRVKNYRHGAANEGGIGVTVVEL
ncbi:MULTISPECIES: endonuclease MutS2 [unclassified Carboxydocella]|uniref:endonuclease MutS2 n=1 Tax=unclassified Carboxydocella TaxID=2685367 RepID=UPI0009AD58AC|nr:MULTISPECIES: endonuclease MutS2 [unclassified Carboxydocella]GAW29240.1 endonuclease MutS2 [Carboxydocella sp. ULO1]GAW30252.1 endonuclease MutS2 [Carboxydocella sp. JDF658]